MYLAVFYDGYTQHKFYLVADFGITWTSRLIRRGFNHSMSIENFCNTFPEMAKAVQARARRHN